METLQIVVWKREKIPDIWMENVKQKTSKKLKKGVDKRGNRVYYMQAASKEAEKHGTSRSNILKRFKNKSKKVLDKRKEMC